MEYKPKVITGKVTGTGWPIDGHVLWFSQWDYDNRVGSVSSSAGESM